MCRRVKHSKPSRRPSPRQPGDLCPAHRAQCQPHHAAVWLGTQCGRPCAPAINRGYEVHRHACLSLACSQSGKGGEEARDGPRRGPVLRSLDLAVLPRDDSGPPSELQARREKFARFEKDCSEVSL